MNYSFKYFEDYNTNARFTGEKCEICGKEDLCLNGIYLDISGRDLESVCISCLVKGEITIQIPEYLRNRLYENIKSITPHLSEELINNKVNILVDELSRTPPVPWVQYNDWPTCCADFMTYIGEWETEDFEKNAADGDGKNYLLNSIDERTKNQIEGLDVLWDDIGYDTIAFVFKCRKCGKTAVVLQSY